MTMSNPRRLGAAEGCAWLVCAAVGVVLAVLVTAVTNRFGLAAGGLTLAAGSVAASVIGRHCGHLATKCDLRHIRRG